MAAPAPVERTQVGIVGAGPAGLLLAQLLARQGIESVVVETRSRDYCEHRQRAGMLEHGSVALLRAAGVADRLEREGLEHGGIYLQYAGERHHLDFRDLVGRSVTIYAQTEIVRDLIATRLADGQRIEFEISDTEVDHLTTDRPVVRYTTPDGVRRQLDCDVVAGCDGSHGVTHTALPATLRTGHERDYPYAWLGILADAPPATDELVYAHHRNGFALHSMRSPEVSRLYLQVGADADLAAWPDQRIWDALQERLGLPDQPLNQGPIREKGITPMRSVVRQPMRYGRLFLAGDSAHIVPPTGAKGLNLAFADVAVLADALVALLRDGRPALADAYSDTALHRVWRATHFSWWMTSMLHSGPDPADFDTQLQLAQLRYVTSSRAAAASLAENYAGLPLPS